MQSNAGNLIGDGSSMRVDMYISNQFTSSTFRLWGRRCPLKSLCKLDKERLGLGQPGAAVYLRMHNDPVPMIRHILIHFLPCMFFLSLLPVKFLNVGHM